MSQVSLSPPTGAPLATIAAIATGAGAGGIGVLRVSGPDALAACLPLAPRVPAPPVPRHAYLSPLVDRRGALLDTGLLLHFRAPASFTGEDVVELHTHGSPALLRLLLRAVLEDGRVRLATPGEFTRRAFLHGKLDLSRAEGVADLIAADSEAAVRAAAAQVSGALAEAVGALLGPLRALHADLQAALDFPDEADWAEEAGAEAAVAARLDALSRQAGGLLAGAERGRLVRRGARVALFGPPNAGKSTLFNALLGEARALVDAEPGTTRDVLEARLELAGHGLTLLDTAGLREAPGRVERLGVAQARAALAGADLAVLVLPEGTPPAEVEAWRREAGAAPLLHARSKADLQEGGTGAGGAGGEGLRVSAHTGEGVEALREAVVRWLTGGQAGDAAGAVLVTSERHQDALRRCAEALGRAQAALGVGTLEVVAGEVGLAHEALGEVTGESASQALLDALFARFCIGK